jgi:hypothetical protein
LDEFGWIDANLIYQVPTVVSHDSLGINQTILQTFTIQLSAVNHPETNQALCATIDTSSASLGEFTYYLEYRTADGWDRGMSAAGINDCVVIAQTRSDQYNYLVTPNTYSNCLTLGGTYADADKDITVTVLGFSNHVATIEVTLPVRHVYKQPVAGPAPVDWHIYEVINQQINEQINVAERSIQSVRSLLNVLPQAPQVSGSQTTMPGQRARLGFRE